MQGPWGGFVLGIECPHRLECCAIGHVFSRRRHENRTTEDHRRYLSQGLGPAATPDQVHALDLDAVQLDGVKCVCQAAQKALDRGSGEVGRGRCLVVRPCSSPVESGRLGVRSPSR